MLKSPRSLQYQDTKVQVKDGMKSLTSEFHDFGKLKSDLISAYSMLHHAHKIKLLDETMKPSASLCQLHILDGKYSQFRMEDD